MAKVWVDGGPNNKGKFLASWFTFLTIMVEEGKGTQKAKVMVKWKTDEEEVNFDHLQLKLLASHQKW